MGAGSNGYPTYRYGLPASFQAPLVARYKLSDPHTQRLALYAQLRHFEPSFASLSLADERLCRVEPRRELHLSDTPLGAHGPQLDQKRLAVP